MAATNRHGALRADAQENYERILAAATRVIARDGTDASLSSIAAAAGVGIGTLYRRFPTRSHLIEAVYRGRVIALCESAPEILADSPTAATAMHSWLDAFITMLIDNRGIPPALAPMLAQDSAFRTETRNHLLGAVNLLLGAGRQDGTLRDDVAAVDIVRSVTGIAHVSPRRDDTVGSVNLLLDGLAPGRRR
ncbi:MAG: TetR family transcriptional regulator [Gordonia sp. (in: high G+C Gram-positive bacteria)]